MLRVVPTVLSCLVRPEGLFDIGVIGVLRTQLRLSLSDIGYRWLVVFEVIFASDSQDFSEVPSRESEEVLFSSVIEEKNGSNLSTASGLLSAG